MQNWLMSLLIVSLSLPLWGTPEIKIRESSRVEDRPYFHLGDIADFRDLHISKEKQIREIQIEKTPKYGNSLIYSSGRLSQILRHKIVKALAPSASEVRLVIPSQVQIENSGIQLTSAEIEPVVLGHLKKTCGDCDFRVNKVRMPILQGLPPSTRWDLQFATPLQHGTINANLVVRAPNQSPRAHWISIQVARFQKVPVAVRVIPMGESFQKNDIRYEWRDLTHATQSIPDEEELVGSLAKMGVPLNAVIFRNYLARVQAVNRGEMVKVVSGGEQWNVSLSAVAQQSGYVGDVIKLSNSNSQRVISGQVIARGVVRVE